MKTQARCIVAILTALLLAATGGWAQVRSGGGTTYLPAPPIRDFRVQVWAQQLSYGTGGSISVSLSVERDAYVYVFDTDPNGVSRQIFPNFFDRGNFVKANQVVTIPSRPYALRASDRAGRESLTMVAVTRRFPVLDRYDTVSQGVPFPPRTGGASALLAQLSKEASAHVAVTPGMAAGATVPTYLTQASGQFVVLAGQVRQVPFTSQPSAARLLLDDRYMGLTPITTMVTYGRHKVAAEKAGYQTSVLYINVGDTGTSAVNVLLKR